MNQTTVALPENTQTEDGTLFTPNEKSKLAEARKRMPLNMLSNLTWFVINIIVGLWYTPYLIAHLGVAVYGLVPLASSITSYLSLLTDGFNSAVGRFLQIELARENEKAANRVFNTSVMGAMTIFGLILPIAFVVSSLAPRIFSVPAGHEQDAQWLVLLTMLSFGITFLSSSFAVSSFSSHRFDLRLVLNILRLSVQTISVVILFLMLSPQLWQVGTGIFLSALMYLLGHYFLCRRLTPQLQVLPGLFDFSRFKEILQFSGWVLINQIGAHLFLSIDLIVANLVFGAFVAGRYGAVLIFSALMRSLVGTISAVLDPIVFALYAKNNLSGLANFSCLTVKFMGLVIALPIGLICGLAKPLLIIWLGPDYADLSWLVVVLIGHLCINLSVVPLFPVQVSTKNVRLPGLMTLVMGIANACLATALALWSGWGYISIAIAGAIVLTAKNAIFTPLYNAHILRLPWWTFMLRLGQSTFAWLGVFLFSYWISLTFVINNLFHLALTGVIIGVTYFIIIFFVVLTDKEKSCLKQELRGRVGR